MGKLKFLLARIAGLNWKQMFQKIILHFNKQNSTVSKVELIEKKGDRTIIELKNVKSNAPINAKVFGIN